MRLVSLQAGTKLNVVPGKAYAELAGMAKEDLKTCADETEQKTGVSFVLEDTENGNVKSPPAVPSPTHPPRKWVTTH